MAVLRRHKALILAKNVLYKSNMKDLAAKTLPFPGALFFAAKFNGLG
jgi:hypothetical protein